VEALETLKSGDYTLNSVSVNVKRRFFANRSNTSPELQPHFAAVASHSGEARLAIRLHL
jgi:hypothetical protein